MSEVAFEKPDTEVEVELPCSPVGWRVLIRPLKAITKTESGFYLPDDTQESEQLLTYVGQIVAMGNLCFQATTRSGLDLSHIIPRPKVGDWVIYGTYGGQRVLLKNDQRFLLMNDDSILATVEDPNVFRAYV